MNLQLSLMGGPADEARERSPYWRVSDQHVVNPVLEAPDHVWLCRIEWGQIEWRVRLTPELGRGKAALYWLERERDESPKQTASGAFVYAHVPDDEISEYVTPQEARDAAGMFGS